MQFIDIFLFEANVLNTDEIRSQLKDLTQSLSEPIQKILIKAAFSAIINDASSHTAVKELPPDSPEWAQKAAAAGDLVRATVTTAQRQKLSLIMHWLEDIIRASGTNPPADDATGIADRSEARKVLNSLAKMTIDQMLAQQTQWWSRTSAANPRNFDGMTKKLDVLNKWSWWKLDSQDAFQREGRVLQNCIGQIYTKDKTDSSGQEIWVLKDPTGQSHVAMRCTKKNIHEIKGIQNRPPIAQLIPYVNPLFSQLNFTVDAGGRHDLIGSGYDYDDNSKKLFHISERYPFIQGPYLSQPGLELIKWSAPYNIWWLSFHGKYMISLVGSGAGDRYDLVNVKNRLHPLFSLCVQGSSLVGIGNLPNPQFLIKPAGMERLKTLLNECCDRLKLVPNPRLSTLNSGAFGLAIYGIFVKNNRFEANHNLAVKCAVINDPRVILSMENPGEDLQIDAVKREPELMPQMKNPSEAVQMAAINTTQYPNHLIGEMIAHKIMPTEDVQIAAAKKDGWILEHLPNASEAVQLAAITHNPMVISWIAYHNAVNKNPPPSEQLQIAAVSNKLDALTQLALYSKHGGWSISPAVQAAAAKNKHNQSEDFKEILDILGDAIDPRVKSYINKKNSGVPKDDHT